MRFEVYPPLSRPFLGRNKLASRVAIEYVCPTQVRAPFSAMVDRHGCAMEWPIVATTPIVTEYAVVVHDVSENPSQGRHVQHPRIRRGPDYGRFRVWVFDEPLGGTGQQPGGLERREVDQPALAPVADGTCDQDPQGAGEVSTRIACGAPKPLATMGVWSSWPMCCGTGRGCLTHRIAGGASSTP